MPGAAMRAAKRIRGTRLRSAHMARRRRKAMRPACRGVLRTSLAAIIALPLCAAFAAGLPLQPVADVSLGGNTTRLDYASFDAGRHLLFIAHLGDSAVIVFDTQARRVIARIANVSKVHGVLAIPNLRRVYASATGTNEV